MRTQPRRRATRDDPKVIPIRPRLLPRPRRAPRDSRAEAWLAGLCWVLVALI